jgi:hypothetical protein
MSGLEIRIHRLQYRDHRLTIVADHVTCFRILLTEGAFREGTFGRRSGTRCLRADECDLLPGGPRLMITLNSR